MHRFSAKYTRLAKLHKHNPKKATRASRRPCFIFNLLIHNENIKLSQSWAK
jgi:hypothetical protein